MKKTVLALCALILLAFGTGRAAAATIHIENGGVDSPTCGSAAVPATDACASLAWAVNSRAQDGDTVQLGTGVFALTTNAIITDKSLTVTGAGPGLTIIDGENQVGAPMAQHGMFRILAPTAPRSVTLSEFSIVNVAKIASGNDAFAVYLDAGNQSVDLSLTNIAVSGAAPALTPNVFAASVRTNNGDLSVDGLHYGDGSGSGLQLIRQKGSVTVENSSFAVNPADTAYALDAYSSGTGHDVSGDWSISGNSFSGLNAIQLRNGLGSSGNEPVDFAAVSITDNSFASSSGNATALRVANMPFPVTDPSVGELDELSIGNNSFSGTSGLGSGILLSGDVADAEITTNTISGYQYGLRLQNSGATADPSSAPTDTLISGNRISGNRPASNRATGVFIEGTNVQGVNANGNWWGCNEPPAIVTTQPAANLPCDAVRGDQSQVTLDTWVELRIDADPAVVLPPTATAEVTVGLDKQNDDSATPAGFPYPAALAMSATRGSLSDGNPALTGGSASVDFTSDDWRSGRSASVSFDNATATHQWATDSASEVLHVETTGVDSGTCGPAQYDPCLTLQQAIDNAVSGDTIAVGVGTFPITSNTTVSDKNLSIIGSGTGDTVFDGQNQVGTPFTQHGTLRVLAPGGGPVSVSLSQVSFVNVGKISSGSVAYAIVADGSGGPVNFTLDDVSVNGISAATNVIPLQTANNAGSVSVNALSYSDGTGNGIQASRHTGPLTVENSTFDIDDSDADFAINVTSSAGADVTGPQTFRGNTFSGRGGIAVDSGGGTAATPAVNFSGQLLIEGNTFNSANASTAAGVRIRNFTYPLDAAPTGSIPDVAINDNTFSGNHGSGINLVGSVAGSQITGNSIRGYRYAVFLQNRGADAASAPAGTNVFANKLVDNKANTSVRFGLYLDTNVSGVTAGGNWWGCNTPPAVASSNPPGGEPCDAVRGEPAQVTRDDWIVMNLIADPDVNLAEGATSNLTLEFNKLNTGDPAPAIFADGTTIPLTATRGSLDVSDAVLSGGTAGATFTSDYWRGGRSVTATYDNQVSTQTWADINVPAVLHVEEAVNGGVDSPSCGPLPNPPCETIAQATANALTGDTIAIGVGSFPITSVINPGNKSLEYIGSGPDDTVVTAGDANNFAQGGMFRFQYDGISGAVKDMTLSGFPKTATNSNRFAIWVQPSLPAPAAADFAADVVVDNVRFIGNTGNPQGSESAVYAAANAGSLTITNSELIDVVGNSILLEQQTGTATITGNTISKPASSISPAIYDMTHATVNGLETRDVTGKHTISDNTINSPAGIQLLAGWNFSDIAGPSAFLGGVEISGNTINSGSVAATGIGVTNATNADDGTPGRVVDLVISGNTLSGSAGNGIVLEGGIPAPVISGNVIRQRTSGIRLMRHTRGVAPNPGTFAHHPTDVTIFANQIVDNNTGVKIDPDAPVTADLSGNWWGCNAGPEIAGDPEDAACDSVSTGNPDELTLDNWVVLRIDATPESVLGESEAATLVAGLDELNTGDPAPAIFPDGTTLPMSATGGSLASSSPTLTNGTTGNTFTSEAAVDRSASASFDNQTVTHEWDDDATVPVVTITSPTNGLQTTDASVDLQYTVTDAGGGTPVCTPEPGPYALDYGVNTITVSCEDAAGNVGSDAVSVARLDVTPPVVTITAPTNGLITSSSSVTLEYDVDDETDTTCNPADGASVALNPGSNSITVVCVDAFGNVGFDSVSVIRDNNAPIVTIVAPANNSVTSASSVPLNFTVINDYGSVSCTRSDGESVALTEGVNTIGVSCTDQAGNVGSDTVNVTRDSTPPTITITAPADGSTTTADAAILTYNFVDATPTVCDPASGTSLPLNFGSNTLSVSCTDAAGNTSSRSVSVVRTSTTPPVVTITAPADGAIVRASSTTVTISAASADGAITGCTPASGSTVPLAIGPNTITVVCTDSFGNSSSAQVRVFRPDALPECAKDVAITDVTRTGSRTRIRGIARIQYAGKRLKLQYQPQGKKTIAQPRVQSNGAWSVVVNRPRRPAWTSNNARYRAIMGRTTTSWVKLSRRMGATAVTYDGNGRLKVTGSAQLPIAKGQPVRVQRSDACGRWRQIGTLRMSSKGTFNGRIPSGGAAASAVYIRVQARVAKSSNRRYRFNTYSIVQPVIIDG